MPLRAALTHPAALGLLLASLALAAAVAVVAGAAALITAIGVGLPVGAARLRRGGDSPVALRRLDNFAALAACGLIRRLPRTLEATRARWGDGPVGEATPLEEAKALNEVLISAIERLKPANDEGEALEYHIVHEEYVRQMSNKQILVRHSISESTFHRHRREAIVILARELQNQEERLAVEASASHPRPTADALN